MRIAGYIILLQCVCEYLNPMKLVPGRSVCVRVCVGGEKGAKVNGGESASGREKGEEKDRARGRESEKERQRRVGNPEYNSFGKPPTIVVYKGLDRFPVRRHVRQKSLRHSSIVTAAAGEGSKQ